MNLSVAQLNILSVGLDKLGISITTEQLSQFGTYLGLIERYNAKFNLTRILGDDAITGHFLDALAGVLVMPQLKTEPLKLLDAGSGVGVPGIPLKIAFPNLSVTLMDSHQKRVGFLEFVCSELGLKDIRAYAGRLEDLSKLDHFAANYDVVTARALAEPDVAKELTVPFLKKNGVGILFISKSSLRDDDLNYVQSPFDINHVMVKYAG